MLMLWIHYITKLIKDVFASVVYTFMKPPSKNQKQLTNRKLFVVTDSRLSSGAGCFFPFTFYYFRGLSYFYIKHLSAWPEETPKQLFTNHMWLRFARSVVSMLKYINRSMKKKTFPVPAKPAALLLPVRAIHRLSGKSNSAPQSLYEGTDESMLDGEMRKRSEGDRKLGGEMSGDFCVLQNQFAPVYSFSSSPFFSH